MEVKILDNRILKEHITFQKPGDVGIDLRACSLIDSGHKIGEGIPTISLRPGACVKIGTGIALSQVDTWCAIFARSGLGSKGVRPRNCVGIIDQSYQGQMIVTLENAGDEVVPIGPLDRIAQLVFFSPVRPDSFDIVSEFTQKTERGESGFGSTGK